ncbi:TetR family transcriptional regulator [Burkholderia pyrrocinia]|uniref:TetR family transcriptional regulator n=1 Tax=Burkholderia pyrrocinia TaxID=60550 RepID=UPI00158EA67D|nr:TetR family transcriptional regulator [Burkholderia pyrrocinia]
MIDDVARRADIPRRTLSRYFGTKKELIHDAPSKSDAMNDTERALPRNPDNVGPEHFT